MLCGTPKKLFEGRFAVPGTVRAVYDVSLDGQRFLMIQDGAGEDPEFIVVENWLEELQRLVTTE